MFIIVRGEVIVEQPLLGVFGKGQLFGDYELLEYKQQPVERKSQAVSRVDTQVFSISFAQILDCFRFFSSIETLHQFIVEKNGFYQMFKNIQVEEQQQEQKIDYQQMGDEFFVTMKRKQEVEQLQQEIQKYKKVKMRKELNERLEKLDDPETFIKELFINKYSHMIGYRNHPLNQEYDFVRSRRHNTFQNKEKKAVQQES